MAVIIPPNLRASRDRLPELRRQLLALAKKEVLVGFPDGGPTRTDNAAITNASLAYVHNTGSPAAGIPQREFMTSGIKTQEDRLTDMLSRLLKSVIQGRTADIDKGYHRIGAVAVSAIKNRISAGVPPPLAESTLLARANRKHGSRKGAKAELASRAAGNAPSTDLAKPLLDTAQMRNAVAYVVRERSKRRG